MHARSNIRITAAVAFLAALGLGPAAAGGLSAQWYAEWYRDFGGRWVARTSSNAFCSLNFAGGARIEHGSITAAGFCPDVFLGRPIWWLEGDTVVIGRQRHAVRAVLNGNPRGHLEGHAVTGEALWLQR